MTTTTTPNVPLPAGVTKADDWKRSPDGPASHRWLEGRYFPSLHDKEAGDGPAELCVYTRGVDAVDDSGIRAIGW
jgi:hypothetical protein